MEQVGAERRLSWLVATYGVAATLIGALGWTAAGWFGLAVAIGALVLAVTWAIVAAIPCDEESVAARYAAELTALSDDAQQATAQDSGAAAHLTDRLAS